MPFFIPVPFSIGTFGALISIREPIPTKKALLDIGFSGPIAGFIVTIPILIIGLMLTGDVSQISPDQIVPGGTTQWGSSIFFEFFVTAFGLPNPLTQHPLAFAGWVGLLVTAINLLPAGQLDGGHIARALLGDKSRYAGYVVILFLLAIGFIYNYNGWILFILIIMFMGVRHPPPLNDVSALDNKRKMVGFAAAAMLVLCFVPLPGTVVPDNYDLNFQLADGTLADSQLSHSIDKHMMNNTWQNFTFPFQIENTGNMPLNLSFEIITECTTNSSYKFYAWLSYNGNNTENMTQTFNTSIELGETQGLTLNMAFPMMTENTTVTIRVIETNYDWENISSTYSENPEEPREMNVTVRFS